MEAVRIAMIGVGDVATRDYLPEWHRLAGRAPLQCVMSRSPERAASVASEYEANRWTTTLEEALSDDVDLVVNLTPAAAHTQVTLAALEAGKDVYSEKPLGMTSSEVEQIITAERRTSRVVAAAPSVVLFPQFRAVRDVLASGAVGDVTAVRAHAGGGVPPWPGFTTDPSHFFAVGSGPWRDMGVYPLHAIVDLFGAVQDVVATSRRTIDEFTVDDGPHRGLRVPVLVDDDWHVTVRTASGVVADIHTDFAVRESAGRDFEVLGRSGTVATDLLDSAAPLKVLERESEVWGTVDVPAERKTGPDHLLGVADLVNHVLEGTPLTLTTAAAAHVVGVLEAAEASAVDGMRRTVSAQPEEGRD